MNKYLKGCLIIAGIAILLIAGIVAWYYYQKASNQRQAKTDEVRFSKLCDISKIFTEMPSVTLVGFDSTEIRQIHFYIVRQGKYVRDSVISLQPNAPYEYVSLQIPFAEFLKNDTILVETGGKKRRFFYLSDFHHYAYLHYGMMGYLGSYDCRLDDHSFLINGKRNDGQLERKFGLVEPLIKIK
jgi:hypothetical protein